MSNKAKYIVIKVDCPDRFNFELRGIEHETICKGEQTYIPDWLTCATSDSELRLVIELDTGKIVNWIRPDQKYVNQTILEYVNED